MILPPGTTDWPQRGMRQFVVAAGGFVLGLIAALAALPALSADVTSTWDGTTNNWTSNHWSSPNYPDNGNGGLTYDAILGSGTVTLDEDIALQKLTLTGGTLTATSNFTLTINDTLSWNGGTMGGTGQTVIGSGAALAMGGTAGGASIHVLSRMLINNGTTTYGGNGDIFLASGTFQNNGGLTVDSISDLALRNGGVFNNAGTFTKLNTNKVEALGGTVFNNTGIINIQNGTVGLESGGTHSGDINGVSGTTLILDGNHSFATGADITGGISLLMRGGTSTDNGLINTTGTVTFQGASWTMNGALTANTMYIAGGTATLNGTLTTTSGGGIISGGTLGGSANWNISSSLAWDGGTMTGAGQTTIGSGATLAMGGTAGSASIHVLNRTLVNNGTTTYSGNGDVFLAGGTFQNNGSFTVDSISDLALRNGGVFNNAGTFTKLNTNKVETLSGTVFNNTGIVNIQNGTLGLESGGTHTGDISGLAGTTLILDGNHSFAASADITGALNLLMRGGTSTDNGLINTAGTVTFQGASWTMNGALTASTLNIMSGTATLNGALTTTSGAGIISGGTFGGSATWNISSSLSWDGGTMTGTGQTVIGSGATLAMGGTAGSASIHVLNRTLVNNGTTTYRGNGDIFLAGGTFQNNGSFTVDSISDLALRNGGVFNNAGTFTKLNTNKVEALSGTVFNNTGIVNIQNGTLGLESGGTHTGDISGVAGTTLILDGNHSFAAGADITGGLSLLMRGGTSTDNGLINTTSSVTFQSAAWTMNGALTTNTLYITGGTATLNGPITTTSGSGVVSGGTLGGSANWNISNSLIWDGGTMTGTGQTVIGSNATLAMGGTAGSGSIHVLNRTLVNNGTITYSGNGDVFLAGGTIQNNGSFTVDSISDLALRNGGAFNNAGTFTKRNSNKVSVISGTAFNNTGTVNILQGTLSLESGGSGNGQFNVSPGATLSFVGGGFNYTGGFTLSNGTLQLTTYTLQTGRVLGTGTIAATSFTNASEVSPGITSGARVGALVVNGAYAQSSVGNLAIDVQGTTPGQFDTVTVNGTAQLGGTLTIDSSNLPAVVPGTQFPIVTAASVSGGFDSVQTIGNNNVYFHTTLVGATVYAEIQNRGDMNGDDVINSTDFDLFAFGLMNRSTSAYFAKCDCDILPQQGGDFSGNGRLDFDDIAGFQNQMSGMGMSSSGLTAALNRYFASTPEPGSATLAILGGAIGSMVCGNRRRRESGTRLLTARPLVREEELKA